MEGLIYQRHESGADQREMSAKSARGSIVPTILMIRPDGRYLAAYSKHNGDRLTHWRVSAEPHDATRALG